MIVADTRFNADEKSVLASLIGKTLEKYRHDEVLDPEHGEDAWGIIGLYADGDAYALTNVRELYNVLGDEDDTPVVHLAKVSSDEIRSHLVGVQQKDWVVGETIMIFFFMRIPKSCRKIMQMLTSTLSPLPLCSNSNARSWCSNQKAGSWRFF